MTTVEAIGLVLGVLGLVTGVYSSVPIYKVRDRAKGTRWTATSKLLWAALYPHLAENEAYRFVRPILARCNTLSKVRAKPEWLVKAARLYIERRQLKKFDAKAQGGSEDVQRARPPHNVLKRLSNLWYDDRGVLLLNHEEWGKIDRDVDEPSRAAVELPTSFALNAVEDEPPRIACYFDALAEMNRTLPSDRITTADIGAVDRFLTPVCIESGFVAPLFLLRGLVRRFDENWPLLLKFFAEDSILRQGESRENYVGDFAQKVQTFNFYCWLLWGPSIPVCTCPAWDVGTISIGQYGYGDEANSFPLYIQSNPSQLARNPLIAAIVQHLESRNGKGHPLAVQARIDAELCWGPTHSAFNEVVAKHRDSIYVETVVNGGVETRVPRLGGIVLRTVPGDDHPVSPEALPYYSAYFWVIVQFCDEAGTPLASDDGRWRNLLPVFEHGNLADADTASMSKHRLVEKLLATLTSMDEAQKTAVPSARLTYRYVCAVDDPGPGHDAAITIQSAEEEGIREMLVRAHAATAAGLRLAFPDAKKAIGMAACDLPLVIDDFIRRHRAR